MLVPTKPINPFAPGVGIEYVEAGDPRSAQCPLIVEGPSVVEGLAIFRRFCDYRIWNTINDPASGISPDTGANNAPIDEQIQRLVESNDDAPEFIDRVDSVTVIYPQAMEAEVIRKLSHLPSPLPLLGKNTQTRTGRVVHLRGIGGTRSFVVHQRPLDIETEEKGLYLCLNIPDDPGWVVYLPQNRPFLKLDRPRRVFASQAEYERSVWTRVEQWLSDKGITVDSKQHPLGSNSFPDYEVSINGAIFDVEITSIPDLTRWTLKSSFRDLESRIQQLAKQPRERKEDAITDLNRILAKKRQIMNNRSREGRSSQWYILVLSNRSTYDLTKDILEQTDFAPFDVVLLDENETISCIYTS